MQNISKLWKQFVDTAHDALEYYQLEIARGKKILPPRVCFSVDNSYAIDQAFPDFQTLTKEGSGFTAECRFFPTTTEHYRAKQSYYSLSYFLSQLCKIGLNDKSRVVDGCQFTDYVGRIYLISKIIYKPAKFRFPYINIFFELDRNDPDHAQYMH